MTTEKGLSLKTTSMIMMIVSLVITAVLLFMPFRTFRSFRNMEDSTDDFIQMEEAAEELMQETAYLTEEAQHYTVLGERTRMENYFKASYDELTGVYNRAGFDLIKTSLDMSTTAMLLFDADQFKSINDQFGHKIVDQVLKRLPL